MNASGYTLTAITLSALIAGCGGTNTITTPGVVPQSMVTTTKPQSSSKWHRSVFVSTGQYVTQFAARNNGKVLNIIKEDAGNATGLAADPQGNLWIDSWAVHAASEYPPNTLTPSRMISEAGGTLPNGIAICPDGNVYVSNYFNEYTHGSGSIDVYNYNTLYFIRQIYTPDLAYGYFVQCDKNSNVYVAYSDVSGGIHFMEFPPGGSGSGKTLPISLVSEVDFKILPSGDIVVPAQSSVQFYHPGKSSPYRTIYGFSGAFALAFAKHDKIMWVLDGKANALDEVSVRTGNIIGSIDGYFSGAADVVVFPPG